MGWAPKRRPTCGAVGERLEELLAMSFIKRADGMFGSDLIFIVVIRRFFSILEILYN
jgi:hypothetical protein